MYFFSILQFMNHSISKMTNEQQQINLINNSIFRFTTIACKIADKITKKTSESLTIPDTEPYYYFFFE